MSGERAAPIFNPQPQAQNRAGARGPSAFDFANYAAGIAAPAAVAGMQHGGHVAGADIVAAGVNGAAVGGQNISGGYSINRSGIGSALPYSGAGFGGAGGFGGIGGGTAGGNDLLSMGESQIAQTQADGFALFALQSRMSTTTMMIQAMSNTHKEGTDAKERVVNNFA